jgi:hypothetical protein
MACTPCAKIRHRQKARQKAKKEREDKLRFEAEMPHLYRHPSPFTTNPYWSEEIMIGPSLPKKGSRSASQRALAKANSRTGSAVAVSSTGGTIAQTSPRLQATNIAEQEDLPTLSMAASMSTADEGWNTKRYQREEEELWGHELSKTGHKLMDAIKQAGSSAGRYMEAKLGMDRTPNDDDRTSFYLTPRNPPVNDYHPPVVSSKPARQDGHHWMLQPPPPAKFMEGKTPVSRTASQTSVVSSRRPGAVTEGLGPNRRASERPLEMGIRESAEPLDPDHLSVSYLARPQTRRTMTSETTGGRSQKSLRSRSHSLSTESDGSDAANRRRRRLHQKQSTTLEMDSDEDGSNPYKGLPSSTSGTITPAHSTKRPKLQTIASSESGAKPGQISTGEQVAAAPLPSGMNETEALPGTQRPLADKTNSPPAAGIGAEAKVRSTGTSIDSGLALQE